MAKGEIVYVPVAKLKRYHNNPRKNDEAVDYVANSIKRFGFRVPVVIDRDFVIVAGDTRCKAAKKLGIEKVPCIVADELTEEQINAYRLVDNKTQELSSWDYSLLMDELTAVKDFDMAEFGFDASGIGDDQEYEEKGEGKGRTTNLDEGYEMDVEDFSEKSFAYVCPCCGFRFNEYV